MSDYKRHHDSDGLSSSKYYKESSKNYAPSASKYDYYDMDKKYSKPSYSGSYQDDYYSAPLASKEYPSSDYKKPKLDPYYKDDFKGQQSLYQMPPPSKDYYKPSVKSARSPSPYTRSLSYKKYDEPISSTSSYNYHQPLGAYNVKPIKPYSGIGSDYDNGAYYNDTTYGGTSSNFSRFGYDEFESKSKTLNISEKYSSKMKYDDKKHDYIPSTSKRRVDDYPEESFSTAASSQHLSRYVIGDSVVYGSPGHYPNDMISRSPSPRTSKKRLTLSPLPIKKKRKSSLSPVDKYRSKAPLKSKPLRKDYSDSYDEYSSKIDKHRPPSPPYPPEEICKGKKSMVGSKSSHQSKSTKLIKKHRSNSRDLEYERDYPKRSISNKSLSRNGDNKKFQSHDSYDVIKNSSKYNKSAKDFAPTRRSPIINRSSKRASPLPKNKLSRGRSVRSRDRSVRSRDRSVRSRDRSVRSRDRSIRSRDRSVRSRDRTVRSRDRSVHSRDRSVHSRDRSFSPIDRTLPSKRKILPSSSKRELPRNQIVSSREKPRGMARRSTSRDRNHGSRDNFVLGNRNLEPKGRTVRSRSRERVVPSRNNIVQPRDRVIRSKERNLKNRDSPSRNRNIPSRNRNAPPRDFPVPNDKGMQARHRNERSRERQSRDNNHRSTDRNAPPRNRSTGRSDRQTTTNSAARKRQRLHSPRSSKDRSGLLVNKPPLLSTPRRRREHTLAGRTSPVPLMNIAPSSLSAYAARQPRSESGPLNGRIRNRTSLPTEDKKPVSRRPIMGRLSRGDGKPVDLRSVIESRKQMASKRQRSASADRASPRRRADRQGRSASNKEPAKEYRTIILKKYQKIATRKRFAKGALQYATPIKGAGKEDSKRFNGRIIKRKFVPKSPEGRRELFRSPSGEDTRRSNSAASGRKSASKPRSTKRSSPSTPKGRKTPHTPSHSPTPTEEEKRTSKFDRTNDQGSSYDDKFDRTSVSENRSFQGSLSPAYSKHSSASFRSLKDMTCNGSPEFLLESGAERILSKSPESFNNRNSPSLSP